ncbi:MAG: transposase [Rhodobacteraceae bacterium]|nr:transposase [Paracoccaceae bacterium]
MLEMVNQEFKRRKKMIRMFPNAAQHLRLALKLRLKSLNALPPNLL